MHSVKQLREDYRAKQRSLYDAVAAVTAIARAETVGLVPTGVLQTVPRHRWGQLDLDLDRTIESRIN